jgi:hypothetical protein
VYYRDSFTSALLLGALRKGSDNCIMRSSAVYIEEDMMGWECSIHDKNKEYKLNFIRITRTNYF